jgi:hypothetical protein
MEAEKKPAAYRENGGAAWIAFCLTLGISFTILKLLGMFVLPWWVALMPFWLPLVMWGLGYLIFFLAIGYIYLIVHFATMKDEKEDDA